MNGEQSGSTVRIGVDLGGTRLRVAAVSQAGQILSHARTATPTGSAQAVVRAIASGVEAVVAGIEAHDGRTTIAGPLVIACPGPLDTARGHVLDTPNLPHLRRFDLAPAVAAALGRDGPSVRLANDATVAALGEATFGAGRGFDPVLFLTVSTGIGGGLVLAGRPYLGAAGQALELGHLIVDGRPGAPPCGAGHAGCLEAHASGSAIARAAAAAGMAAGSSAADVATAARGGDTVARAVLVESARWLGLGIASAINAFDPAIVVLGGGVMGAWDQLRAGVMEGVEAVAMGAGWRRGGVGVGSLGDDAGVVGATCWRG